MAAIPSGPNPYFLVDPGQREARMATKRKKLKHHVLKSWMFSLES